MKLKSRVKMLSSDRILLLLFFLAMTISSLVILTSSPHLKLDMGDTLENEDWFEWGILRWRHFEKQRLDLGQKYPWYVLWVYLTFRYFDNFWECNILSLHNNFFSRGNVGSFIFTLFRSCAGVWFCVQQIYIQ